MVVVSGSSFPGSWSKYPDSLQTNIYTWVLPIENMAFQIATRTHHPGGNLLLESKQLGVYLEYLYWVL